MTKIKKKVTFIEEFCYFYKRTLFNLLSRSTGARGAMGAHRWAKTRANGGALLWNAILE